MNVKGVITQRVEKVHMLKNIDITKDWDKINGRQI
jgi:hypothetical protein